MKMLNCIKGLPTSKKVMPARSQQHNGTQTRYFCNITLSAVQCIPAVSTHGILSWNLDTLAVPGK